MQRGAGAEVQRCNVAVVQCSSGAEVQVQRCRGAEVQRCKLGAYEVLKSR